MHNKTSIKKSFFPLRFHLQTVIFCSSMALSLVVMSLGSLTYLTYVRSTLESQLIHTTQVNAQKEAVYMLGYFLEQENWIHLEQQQKLLADTPNILYAYILNKVGTIESGIDGLESEEVGATHQPWETDLDSEFLRTRQAQLIATPELAQRFSGKVEPGEKFLLMELPVSSPSRSGIVGYLRVAMSYSSISVSMEKIREALLIYSLVVTALFTLGVNWLINWLIFPLRVMIPKTPRKPNLMGTMAIKLDSPLKKRWIESIEIQEIKSNFENYMKEKNVFDALHATASTAHHVAHEVRRPFSLMHTFLDTIKENQNKTLNSEFVDEFVEVVTESSGRVDRLLKELIQLNNPQIPNLSQEMLTPLLIQALKSCKIKEKNSDVSIIWDLKHTKCIEGNAEKLLQVFENILINACEATMRRTVIRISTWDFEGQTSVSILNTDSHIPQEHLPHIFDVFWTSGKENGSGLGLHISKSIVETIHNGKLICHSEVNSTYPSGYVEFVITLRSSNTNESPMKVPLPKDLSEVSFSI